MKELSFTASTAWHLSAQEVAAGKQVLIEAEHILPDICSGKKIYLSIVLHDLGNN